jgi:hypothetical protein
LEPGILLGAVHPVLAFRRASAMTYKQAKRWLRDIGGEWTEAKEQVPHRGSVIVWVTGAGGAIVQRHALFDDRLTGRPRQVAISDAFVRACDELEAALAEPGTGWTAQ